MERIVVDASVAAGWLFEDEDSTFPDAVLAFLETGAAVVPSLFWLEVANLAILAERRKRVEHAKVAEFFSALLMLPFITDYQIAAPHSVLGDIGVLAVQEKLTVYDAAYLELARRERLVLATLDQELLRAAPRVGVSLFELPN